MAETIPAPLKGKAALITGGSRGIGASIAKVFAQKGCTHIATSYASNKEKAEDVLKEVQSINSGIKTYTFAANVLDPDFGKKVVEEALKGLGVDRIDIVVANAALLSSTVGGPTALELTHEKFTEHITGTCWSAISTATAAVKHMPKGGRVILISSGNSKIAAGDPFLPYAAAKAGMEAAAKQMAAAWGPSLGVTVNTISVGATETDTLLDAFEALGPQFRTYAEQFSLLKRIAAPAEVAEIVAFVASPQAAWITGNLVPANGGALAMLQG